MALRRLVVVELCLHHERTIMKNLNFQTYMYSVLKLPMKQNMNCRKSLNTITWSKVGLCILMLSWGAFAGDEDNHEFMVMNKRFESSTKSTNGVSVTFHKPQTVKKTKKSL